MHHRALATTRNIIKPRNGFIGVALRELRKFRSDGPQKLLLLCIVPLIVVLFCGIYNEGTLKDVPLGICDLDKSKLSRMIVSSFDATKLMRIAGYVNTPKELASGIATGIFEGGVYIPSGLESEIKAGNQVQPVIYRNGIHYLISSYIGREGVAILRTINAGIVFKKLYKTGMNKSKSMFLVSPVVVDASNLYNTSFSYLVYLVPGIVFSQVGMAIMISGAICFAREREHGSLRMLHYRSGGNTFGAMHGKSLPYAFIVAILTLLILLFLFPLFAVCSFFQGLRALPGVLMFFTASWWIGALGGIIAGQVMLASEIAIFIGMPSFIFSGWTFPLPAAPDSMVILGNLLPFTHFMPLWFTTTSMNHSIEAALFQVGILIAMIVIAHELTRLLLGRFWVIRSNNHKTAKILTQQSGYEITE